MDFTANHPHPHHHHPHLHHPHNANSVLPSSSASQCPALRAASARQNYQLPVPSPAQSSMQYDRSHSNTTDENRWLLRPTPSGAAPSPIFSRDRPHMGHLQDQMQPSQSTQQALQCPTPVGDVVEAAESAFPLSDPFYPYIHSRPTMHPPPRLFGQQLQPYLGYENAMSRQPNSHHPSDYHWPGPNAGFPPLNPSRPAPASQGSTTAPYLATATGQTRRLFTDENTRPGAHPCPRRDVLDENSSLSSSPEARGPSESADPALQAGARGNEGSPRSVSRSPSMPASAVPERTSEQATHILNPVYIRRIDMANTSRPRQSIPRAATTADRTSDYEMLLRQGELSLIEFAETHPGVLSNWEIQRIPQSVRKRVASKRALESLQSVDIATLPDSERMCVICYNDFGVASPEGINEAPLRLPKCKHVFGDHCIKKWFEESDTCPYCRDKVHSELLCTGGTRRPYPAALRFMARFHASAQHAQNFRGAGQIRNQSQSRNQIQSRVQGQGQGQGQGQRPRDHEAVDFDWMRSEHNLTDHALDDYHGMSSDAGAENESRMAPGIRRIENQNQSPSHSARYASLLHGSLGRRSPPRRPRPRLRFGQAPSAGTSLFGGPTSSSTSQTSVRPSRNSRSRSPFDRTGTSGGLRSRRSLTDSTEQHRWNRSPSPESNHGVTASPSSGPLRDFPNFHFQSQLAMPPEDLLQRLSSPNTGAQATNENQPGPQQTRLEQFRFPSSRSAMSTLYAADSGHVASNQFTSYQQL